MDTDAFFNKLAPFIDYLAGRWRDESEYEDISEYSEAIKKRMPEGFTFLAITKRPFGFKFSGPDNAVHHMRVKGSQVVM